MSPVAQSVQILDVPVRPLTMPQAVAECADFFASPGLKQVVTANPEMALAAARDEELRQVLESADLVVADGVGLVWAARRLGQPLPDRIPGVELAWELLSWCAAGGYPVFLLGGAPGVAAEAAAKLSVDLAGLRVAGFQHGYFAPEEEDEVVRRVAHSGARLLLVGMGTPRQEKWIYRHRERLGAQVAMGVGGSLDVFAGRVKRAPRAWRRLHLEWLYRGLSQPRRWRRLLQLPRFCLRVWFRAPGGGQ